MNETKSIGVGLIGYGFAGKTFHAPLIRAVEGLTLTGIASSDAAKVRKDFPGMQVFDSPAAMIAEPGIELIVIATPNDSHAPLARAALLAGKHAVIDKPFTLDMAEARDLIGGRLQGKVRRVVSEIEEEWFVGGARIIHELDGVIRP